MNRQCKCTDCGYVFDYEDRTVVKESHGFNDGFYETFSCCPNCGGDFEDAADCCECGETFTENELYSGWCEKCLRETITYDTFFEYCEANKEHNYLDTFVMCYMLNCDEVPKHPSWDFHQLMISTYNNYVRSIKEAKVMGSKYVCDILEDCICFIMDDDGSIGRENYADWLNKREVKQWVDRQCLTEKNSERTRSLFLCPSRKKSRSKMLRQRLTAVWHRLLEWC